MGVGSKGIIPMGARDLEEALEMGMDWSLREGYAWAEDKVHVHTHQQAPCQFQCLHVMCYRLTTGALRGIRAYVTS